MDRHGLWLEEFARKDSVVLQKFTNEQLHIIKQAIQQNRFPDTQTIILLANQFNTDFENVSVCCRYYRFIAKINVRRQRIMSHAAA